MLGGASVLDPGQEGEISMTRMTEHDSAATRHLVVLISRLRNSRGRRTRTTRRLRREDTVDSRNITKITDYFFKDNLIRKAMDEPDGLGPASSRARRSGTGSRHPVVEEGGRVE